MIRTFSILSALVLASCAAMPASAQEVYVRGAAGIAGGYEDFTIDRGRFDAQFDNDTRGGAGNVAIGIEESNVRIEASFTGIRFEGERAGSIQCGNKGTNGVCASGEGRRGGHNMLMAGVNAAYDFDLSDRVALTLGGGVNASKGVGCTYYASQDKAGWHNCYDGKWRLGVTGTAAVSYNVGDGFRVGVRGTYERLAEHNVLFVTNGGREAGRTTTKLRLPTSMVFVEYAF